MEDVEGPLPGEAPLVSEANRPGATFCTSGFFLEILFFNYRCSTLFLGSCFFKIHDAHGCMWIRCYLLAGVYKIVSKKAFLGSQTRDFSMCNGLGHLFVSHAKMAKATELSALGEKLP